MLLVLSNILINGVPYLPSQLIQMIKDGKEFIPGRLVEADRENQAATGQ